MKRLLAIISAALCATAHAQTTSITVLADTNRVVRTNFTIGNAQVTGLSGLLDGKLATNGNASALTNITAANVVGTVATASNITGILAISNGGTGSTSASNARTALGLGTAATNDATNFQAANTNLTALASGDGSSLTNISGASNPTGDGGSLTNLAATNLVGTVATSSGGTGGTNATSGLANLLPAYASNAAKVLAVTTNETGVEWVTASGGGGGGVTSIDASGGSTGMSFSGGPITNSGTLTLAGTLAVGSGGTGAGDVTNARVNLLPAYTNNANKALIVNSNATDIQWASFPSVPVAIADGGTGATNVLDALINLKIAKDASSVAILSSTNVGQYAVNIGQETISMPAHAVAIGKNAFVDEEATYGVAIGSQVYVGTNSSVGSGGGVSVGGQSSAYGFGAAIGYSADVNGNGGAVGKSAYAEFGGAVGENADAVDGFAGGKNATASADNSVQLGTGTNSTENTIQIYSAGKVDTNKWAALANAGIVGTNLLRSTNITGAQAAIFTNSTTNAPTNTNAPTPSAWLDIRVGTNDYKLPLWQ